LIAQISDTHLGLARAPDAADNLRKVVNMVNQRHPDAVLVTGDIGETPEAWAEARGILQDLQAKSVFYIPGNHDVNAHNLERWRALPRRGQTRLDGAGAVSLASTGAAGAAGRAGRDRGALAQWHGLRSRRKHLRRGSSGQLVCLEKGAGLRHAYHQP